MKAEIRPSTPADVAALLGKAPAFRALLITLVVDGEPAAIGGVLVRPDGYWASAQITDTARRAAVSLHRAGKRIFDQALAKGYRPIYATAEPGQPRAIAWLERLGFKPAGVTGAGVPVLILS